MSKRLDRAAPRSGPAPWQGGKRLLADRIVRLIDSIPHECYAEPFLGMGGVFFRREVRSKSEVVNDYSREVATLFRVLQRHFPEFVGMIRWRLASRAEFERLVNTDPSTLTDLENAARFLYLQRLCFGGRVRGRTFGVAPDRGSRFNVVRLIPELEDLHERLAGVVIERLPYAEFIRRYDRPTTLFYLDPPYYGCEEDYGPGLFERADFERLAEALRELQGRFVLSINDRPEVRRLFEGFKLTSVATTYSITANGMSRGKRVGELLVTDGR